MIQAALASRFKVKRGFILKCHRQPGDASSVAVATVVPGRQFVSAGRMSRSDARWDTGYAGTGVGTGVAMGRAIFAAA